MMKIAVFAFFVATAMAIPVDNLHEVPIVAQESDVQPDGSYHYSYEGGDGSKVSEAGQVHALDKDHTAEAVVGTYEYKGDDGHVYHVEYTADENGYQPHGDHIPVVPEPIARALKWAVEHPYVEPAQVGQHH